MSVDINYIKNIFKICILNFNVCNKLFNAGNPFNRPLFLHNPPVSNKRFNPKIYTWCDLEERNRFMWLGIAFMCGIGTVLPITLSAIVFIGGNNLALWIIACTVNLPILVVNLAAQATKITLPTLF